MSPFQKNISIFLHSLDLNLNISQGYEYFENLLFSGINNNDLMYEVKVLLK